MLNIKVDYIYHLADLHIRNLKRHKEYREILNQFLVDVDSQKKENAIIYLAGDIAHAKTEMSPELVREITWFFNECANRFPTFVITGNHDCSMKALPLGLYPNGNIFYYIPSIKPEVVLVHFNWVKGHEKMAKMKAHEMWLLTPEEECF